MELIVKAMKKSQHLLKEMSSLVSQVTSVQNDSQKHESNDSKHKTQMKCIDDKVIFCTSLSTFHYQFD